jgi:predicted nucleotidyltransferase
MHERQRNEGSAMTTSNNVITLADLRAKRAEILQAAARHGAKRVRVFGSVARADARANSDIDFLVELEPGRDVADLSEFTLDLEEILERDVHVVDTRPPFPLRDEIEQQAIPL